MPELRVKEKEQWRELCEKRIDRKIGSLFSKKPGLKKSLESEIEKTAAETLGVVPGLKKIEELDAEIAKIERQKKEVWKELASLVDPDGSIRDKGWRSRSDEDVVDDAIEDRKESHREEVMKRDPVSAEVWELLQEKERMDEILCLATTGKQLKTFWAELLAKLGEEPTDLESAAMRT